ncbi:hypothetical protein SNE40_004986 [Patella caerulea]|uniref:Uncharacterized protein n=1 Tax=Patella caerulea TaxID=87958 RepID=A0AAN8Q1K4_PATCE
MTSLISVPVREPYQLINNQFDGQPITEVASIFRPDFNTFITGKDKLHKWAMWRTNVNHSFIRNLPVPSRNAQPVDEATVREKRIDIDRFLIYSDTDELKRLHMKDTYGTCDYFTSRLGESTYFLYGLPRICLQTAPPESRQVRAETVVMEEPEPLPPPPKPRTQMFVGAGQLAKSLDGQSLKPIELSHAQKIKYGQIPENITASVTPSVAPSVAPSVRTIAQPEVYHEVWKKTYLVKDNYDDMSVHNYKWDSHTVASDTDDSDKIADNGFIVIDNKIESYHF